MPTELPEDVWTGLFQEYRSIVKGTTEAPDSYHYIVFATIFGIVLGRGVSVHYVDHLYPNFYICLVGVTGLPRKGTATKRGVDLLHHVEPNTRWMHFLPGLSSAEGLLHRLNGENKRVLAVEEEFRTILNKSQQRGNILIPKLNELYDCRDLVTLPKVKESESVVANHPFVSMITSSTQNWLQEFFQSGDISGGLGNRLLYVLGETDHPIPRPPRVDSGLLNELANKLIDVRVWGENQGEIGVSAEADRIWEVYYIAHWKRTQGDELHSILARRLPSYIWKLALLYAAQDKSAVVEEEHLVCSIKAADFFESNIMPVFEGYGQSRTQKVEAKIIKFLDKHGPSNARDVYRSLNISQGEFNHVLKPLLESGVVKHGEFKFGTRKTMLLTLVKAEE